MFDEIINILQLCGIFITQNNVLHKFYEYEESLIT